MFSILFWSFFKIFKNSLFFMNIFDFRKNQQITLDFIGLI